MLRHVVTYSTRHCCSFCRWRELTILLQAAAPSVPGCPSVLQRRWPLVPLQPRQGTGLGRGSPARLRQSWQQSGGCPTPQCSSRASSAAHLSASNPLLIAGFPKAAPACCTAGQLEGVWQDTPDTAAPKPARPSFLLLAPCKAGGHSKPQSSCSQLLRHIWVAMCAL